MPGSDRKCKLAMDCEEKGLFKKYLLWIDETLVSDLPPAPAIAKENITVVCQSENFVYMSEVIIRITYNVFVKGELSQIVAEHNRRSLCTILEVDGKIVKQWDGVTLA